MNRSVSNAAKPADVVSYTAVTPAQRDYGINLLPPERALRDDPATAFRKD
jgi:hypothetical protein